MHEIGRRFSFLILIIVFSALLVLMAACEKQTAKVDENKAMVRRVEELWNTGNLAAADEIFAIDFVNHDPSSPDVRDLVSYKEFITRVLNAFPDFHVTVDDILADGEKVATRWTATGTHQGELMGIPPTGKQATWSGMTIYRIVGGKIVEAWWTKDMYSLLMQLGVIPPPEPVKE
jgi:steroid delta-isomerase-like uncharacterized protein